MVAILYSIEDIQTKIRMLDEVSGSLTQGYLREVILSMPITEIPDLLIKYNHIVTPEIILRVIAILKDDMRGREKIF